MYGDSLGDVLRIAEMCFAPIEYSQISNTQCLEYSFLRSIWVNLVIEEYIRHQCIDHGMMGTRDATVTCACRLAFLTFFYH